MKLISILVISLLVSGCSQGEANSKPLIHGVWLLKTVQDFGYATSHIAYSANGQKCEISVKYSYKGDNTTHYHMASWRLDGKLLTTVLEESTSSRPTGIKTTYAIHKLTEESLNILQEKQTDFEIANLEEHLRVAEQDPSVICLVVEGALRKKRLVNQLEQNRL